jgi:hypothetical protein
MSDAEHIRHASDEHAAERPLGAALALGRRGSSGHEPSPHSHKFLAVTWTLFGIAIAAIAVALGILLGGSTRASSVIWSAWSPPDSGLAGERDIADEIAPLYRATPAAQLVIVTVRNISASGSGTQLALRDPNNGSLSAISGNTAVYTMCGLGPNCAIAAGTPSAARLLLLRREALELAMYTFKYISGVDSVVAILPPGHTQQTAALTRKPPAPGKTTTTATLDIAVVFQRSSLQHFLSQPLRATLPEVLPPTVGQMSGAPEAELVSVITGQALFSQQLIQAQDGTGVLVLSSLPPQ